MHNAPAAHRTLDRIPRRYIVEARKTLEGNWDLASDGGSYRLWVLGPNGFHRHFIGDLKEQGDTQGPEIQVCYMTCSPAELALKLHNKSSARCFFIVSAEAYRSDGPWTIEVGAGEVGSFHWSLADSGNWYEFSVTCSAQKTFRRRVAGRIENGIDSVSDPSLGRS
ncbi:phospholipase domain-containing protein [Janthinobacterium tructae]